VNRADRLIRFEKACRARGLALTVQRRVILQELLDREDHPTAEEVYEAVRDRIPGLSRTTVYRVLDTLVDVGAARRVPHPSAVARFDATTDRHHHLVCERCGRLADLHAWTEPDIPLPEVGSTGFRIADYSISFVGVCARCEGLEAPPGGMGTWKGRRTGTMPGSVLSEHRDRRGRWQRS